MELAYCEMLCVLCSKKYEEVMSLNSDQVVIIGTDTDPKT